MKNHDSLVYYGDAVKALGNGKVGGMLVRFGGRDLEGEYFTKDTYFGARDGDGVDTLFHHGIPLQVEIDGKSVKFTDLANHIMPPLKTERQELGIWAEVVLNMADEYQALVYQMAEAGKLGWSSGAAGHTVQKTLDGEIKRWLIAEGSLTPTPAEPRNVALSLKSFINSNDENELPMSETQEPEDAEASASVTEETKSINADKNNINNVEVVMTEQLENVSPTQEDESVKSLSGKVDKLSEAVNAMIKMAEESPRINRTGAFTVDGGDADPQIKSVLDLLVAIKRGDTKRLTSVYKAQTEGTGATGGVFVGEQTLTDLGMDLTMTSGIGNLVRRIPVSSPSGRAPIKDYSRTPTADDGSSASALGIESQSRSESGAFVEETGYFEFLRWNVTDFASGYIKISKELSEDAPMVQAMLEVAIREDVANRDEFQILRGNGTTQYSGVLGWAGTIGLNEDTDNTFAVADMDEMVSRLLANGNSRVAWAYHPLVYTDVAGFERGTGGAVAHNIIDALPSYLSGYPQFKSQHLPAQGTSGYVVLGDWSKYYVFERGGLYIQLSEHADFLNGNDVWRFGKRADGKPAMTSNVTLADGTNTLSPFVKLNNLS